jgi:CRISPR/Cas system-associated exonuclease Cas4 (RecB family)
MANKTKVNKAAERLAETTRDSYLTVVDHTVGLQERNVRFAQGVIDDSIQEVRNQAESNRAIAQELVERAEQQRDAFQTLVEESVDAYMDLAYAPLSYYRESLEATKSATR